jgi:hypothetical protein
MIYGFKDNKKPANRKIIWVNYHNGFFGRLVGGSYKAD